MLSSFPPLGDVHGLFDDHEESQASGKYNNVTHFTMKSVTRRCSEKVEGLFYEQNIYAGTRPDAFYRPQATGYYVATYSRIPSYVRR